MMKISRDVTSGEEKIVLSLRSLYCQYGYVPFKISNFEEYELYMKNKDFLVSDSIISFSDTNGRMLALKPDVTFSVIKSTEDNPGFKRKVCYNENVYRVSDKTHRFREIMQSGLECIGSIDIYDIYEVINLAAKSLSVINSDFIIQVSCLDVIAFALDECALDDELRKKALKCISEKNRHDLERLCVSAGISAENTGRILSLVDLSGERKAVVDKICKIFGSSVSENMGILSEMLSCSEFSDRIIFDFSVVNDMDYYNGFVFRGFIKGVPSGVLSGGQYDRMMARLGRTSRAVGFAIYMDKLEDLFEDSVYCADCIVLYDDNTDKKNLISEVRRITDSGLSADVQKECDESFKGQIIDLRKGGRNA